MTLSFPQSPTGIIGLIARVSFGISLLSVGLSHYMNFTSFRAMVTGDLGYAPIMFLGTLWAYVLPALMIVGGALLVLGMFTEVAVWTSGIAIGSIPAGMLLKSVLSGIPLANQMPDAINAFTWLIVLIFVVKLSRCCAGAGDCCAKK